MSTNGDPRVITLNQGERYTTDTYSVPLSATEREQQRVAYVAAVDAMATRLVTLTDSLAGTNVQVSAILDRLTALDSHEDRIDALERAAAVSNTRTVWQRIRGLAGL